MQEQTNVVVKCPNCFKEYVQTVTGRYIGPRKRVPNYSPLLQERCRQNGQTFDRGEWCGLMLCAACSLLRCPPALQPALQRWLEHGEVRE